MKSDRRHNFHIPLPDELYGRLRVEAERSKQPATHLARQAIELWLRYRQKMAHHQAIAAYAAKHRGSPTDLDSELEAASLDLWLAEAARGRK